MIKNIITGLSFILILSGCQSARFKSVESYLYTGTDSTRISEAAIPKSEIVDVKFCLEHNNYPPRLSESIFWSLPDTVGMTTQDKEMITYKYEFDEFGRVKTYYYQGSYISGIFPLVYSFEYRAPNSNVVTKIVDPLHRITYSISYDDRNNIRSIEKLDSVNSQQELLAIKSKPVKNSGRKK